VLDRSRLFVAPMATLLDHGLSRDVELRTETHTLPLGRPLGGVRTIRWMTDPWWKSAVVYQIYPRSFRDTDGDGVGDLEGIRRGLDHLEWLGVDAIWLSPIFRSPMADFGYDVSDYCDIDPLFGSLADFDRLVADAHQRGIKVLLDWVPNHSSDRHPWFAEHPDWYVWRDGPEPGTPPTAWDAAFGGKAWTWDEARGQWYLHLFLPEQPDLDWTNPEVEAAMHEVLRFWLDRGVDGFRADVVHLIGKDVRQGSLVATDRTWPESTELTHALLRRVRAVLDSYDGDRVMVGEVYILDTGEVAKFYGDGDELHLPFNFPPLFAPWSAEAWRAEVDTAERVLVPRGWPTWVLSNHDNPRHRTRYGSEARARAAAVLLLGLRGTAFLYAGEELGLEDAVVPEDRVVDPGGRDGCRAPVPWTADPGHGWPSEPWLPWPPHAGALSVDRQRHEPASVLHLYRQLLAARKASPALSLGDLALVHADEAVLAWSRTRGEDRRLVAVNFTAQPAPLALDGGWALEVASDGATTWSGTLAPDQAVVLRPA
ncbi:MAG: putative glycosyl hydrolase, family 13, partial [Actinomycetia bacterium]|nr:putative glycosyl hydrolase, family 13 [Actinomycetes bacterium]